MMIADAERRFAVRIKLALPPGGFGTRLMEMHEWLDQNAGADGWTMTPAGFRGVVNDAVAVYFADVQIASAFVARWCHAHRVEVLDGLLRMRDDEPKRRHIAKNHSSPPRPR